MDWTDALGILFGMAMAVVGLLLLDWAVFDGTYSGWSTLPDGTEGTMTQTTKPASRLIVGAFGTVLAAPIVVICCDPLRPSRTSGSVNRPASGTSDAAEIRQE